MGFITVQTFIYFIRVRGYFIADSCVERSSVFMISLQLLIAVFVQDVVLTFFFTCGEYHKTSSLHIQHPS